MQLSVCVPISTATCFLFVHMFIQLLQTAMPAAIDNDIQGDPLIECGDGSLTFSVKTKRLFAGRIFVKGKTAEAACLRADFAKQQTSSPSFDLSFGSCGMKGQRADEPHGMFYTVVLVVSFHPMFVTEVDRAYHVKCFFEEALRTITAGLDVSLMSTAGVTASRQSIGACTYTIHQGTNTTGGSSSSVGPPISVAQVGDKIVHKWECNDAMYGILVRSCYVTDGFGTQAEVIDNRGCPVDPVLISGISYDSSLTQAYAESHVFKFADRPGVWFYCQLQMCLKMSQACVGVTPPSCAMMPPAISGGASDAIPGTRPPGTGATTPLPSDSATASTVTVLSSTPSGTLPPAPPWSGNASDPTGGETSRETPAASSSFAKDTTPDKKKVLFLQGAGDDNVAASTRPPVYEEEELIYDGPDYDSSPAATPPSSIAPSTGKEAIVVTGFRRWRRPSPTAGSIERAVTYRAHRRSTATVARAPLKRSATSAPEAEQDADDETRSTRRHQEIEKKLHRPVSDENHKRQQKQQRVLQQHQRRKDSSTKQEMAVENENTFMYRDSELSNRLIIFDVDEEPPPDYVRWSRHYKPTANADGDDDEAPTARSATGKESGGSEGGSPKKATTAATGDGCVVSAQGLIMILAASGSLSTLLVILLVAVCARYRVASAPKKYQRRAQKPLSESDDSGITRQSDESEDHDRRINGKAGRWQQQRGSNTDTCTLELPRLPRPNERRKHR